MSRAPYVMGKPDAAYARSMKLEDSTLGWRFVNPEMKRLYGVDSMAETAENVAAEHGIARADQDAFAYRSQMRAAAVRSPSRPTSTRGPTRRSRRSPSSNRLQHRPERSPPATHRESTMGPRRSSSQVSRRPSATA
jgi:hypothetical protein